jgi:hypothetical protein
VVRSVVLPSTAEYDLGPISVFASSSSSSSVMSWALIDLFRPRLRVFSKALLSFVTCRSQFNLYLLSF